MEQKFNPQTIRLIVGLGNVGSAYNDTYHNVGFTIVNYFSNYVGIHFQKQRRTLSLVGNYANFFFAKPTTMMNNSGNAVARLLKKYNVTPRELLVIHDDSDIILGSYKIERGRGSAGHHGIDSIINTLRSSVFWRARIGIRPFQKTEARLRAGDFVLKKMKRADSALINSTGKALAEIIFVQKDQEKRTLR